LARRCWPASAARHLALAYGVTVETKSDNPDLGKFADGATALGIVIDVPLIPLIGLPLSAAVAGWLLAGREPEVISRQPLD
jgi:hypothetical protein